MPRGQGARRIIVAVQEKVQRLGGSGWQTNPGRSAGQRLFSFVQMSGCSQMRNSHERSAKAGIGRHAIFLFHYSTKMAGDQDLISQQVSLAEVICSRSILPGHSRIASASSRFHPFWATFFLLPIGHSWCIRLEPARSFWHP